MLTNIKHTFTPAPGILQKAQTGEQMKQGKIANVGIAMAIGLAAAFSPAIVIVPAIVMYLIFHNGLQDGANIDLNGSEMLLVQLASTVVPIIALMLYVKFLEKRSLNTMGFVKKKAVRDYLTGIVIAFAMFSACVGLCVATGAMTFDGYVLNGQYGLLAAFLVGFLVQGLSEEVVCRGFMLTSVGSKNGALIGMLVNSLLFGLLHLGNSGVTFFSIANIILFGILMSIVVLKTDSLWMAAAIHSIWNFVQGNFYGVLVSGIDAGPSVFRCTALDGMDWLNGGSFGMEGGAATTLVLTLCIAAALLLPPRQSAIANP